MNKKQDRGCSTSRRRFLRSSAAGGVVLAAGVGGAEAAPAPRCDPQAEALMRRYGGEFGNFKPGDR